MARAPRVFSIAPTAPFLPTLARGLIDGALIAGFVPRNDPALLADATIYLPTRRAARALGEALLDALGTNAALLPRIVPLGDVDEEAFAFELADLEPLAPAIEIGERRLALAKLIASFAKTTPHLLPASPAIAVALADELAHLMDDFITAGIPFAAVKTAVRGDLDQYWERSRDFLEIVDKGWAAHLAERGRVDAAGRRDELLSREAKRLAKSTAPVIAAGSTGTLPKVAELLRTIAHRESGAVVLPGLDRAVDDAAFNLIGRDDEPLPGHPQFGLKRLIEKIGIAREAVEPLGEAKWPAREKFFSAAFLPSSAHDPSQAGSVANALEGITVVEAADPREEALVIAIALREALDRVQMTAALVTPDRALARRVCAELTRWDVSVDDSAGLPLGDSEAGRFARLIAEASRSDASPAGLLALLRHPYLRETFSGADADLLEIACLRGPRAAGGAQGLTQAIAGLRQQKFHRREAQSELDDDAWDRAAAAAQKLAAIVAPLAALDDGECDFAALVAAHHASVREALSHREDNDAVELDAAFASLAAISADAPNMRVGDYAAAFPAMIRERTVRPAPLADSRIRILGPLEARMISVDRIVLGGLCEDTWPPEAHSDSWLNRPMRRALGLDLPERRVGLSAHDFVQAAGSPEVLLVRAQKQGGVETIASRFLQRLAAVADDKDWTSAVARGEKWLALTRRFEEVPPRDVLKPPRPAPPAAMRPRQFSVSDVRDLVRDPYTIFAKHILRLNALKPVDENPSAAQRGILLHAILAEFAESFPQDLPANAAGELLRIGRAEFAALKNFPAAWAIWWPRFERAARWFAQEERARRKIIARVHSEKGGKTEIAIGGVSYLLTARADRIDVNRDGSIAILDYKTGELPTLKQGLLGYEPQLPLEAAILRRGGFDKAWNDRHIRELGPVKISGGIPPGRFALFEFSGKLAEQFNISDFDRLADVSFEKFKRLLEQYADPRQPYLSTPRAKWSKRYNEYDHLARIREWSAAESDES